MKKRLIAAAVPVLVAGSLAAAAPSISQAAAGNDGPQTAPRINAKAAAAELVPCVGGKQKKALTGGNSGWFSTSSTGTVVPGTELSFRGPESGKDTVFVTFTATNTYVQSASDYGQVRVQLDGVTLKPANASAEYYYNSNNYASFAGQYCIKVGGGWHDLRVLVDSVDWDASGGDLAWLHNAMVHVEVAN